MMSKLTLVCLLVFTIGYSQTEFKLDSIHQYSWDNGLMDWKHNTRDLYTYDNGGNKETNLLRLVLSGSLWVNFYQFNKTYNENNDLLESITQNWSGSAWVNGARASYTYDTMYRKTAFAYAIYSLGNWVTFNENFYSYNAMGDLMEDRSTTRDFVNMVMINDKRRTLYYQDGLLDYDIEEEWRTALDDWENNERREYDYNGNNDNSLVEYRGWGLVSMTWSDPYKQTIITYNSANLPEEITEQVKAMGIWVNTSKVSNMYDANGNLLESVIQEWDSSLSVWVNSTRQVRSFDTNDNEIELIYQTWNVTTAQWDGFLKIVSFWSEAEALSKAELNVFKDIKLYPNPVSKVLNVSAKYGLDKLELFDVLGHKILETTSANKLHVEQLKTGVYLLKVYKGGNSILKRIIID